MGRAIISSMLIHIGVICDVCRTVHFIATSPHIAPSLVTPGMYVLTCRRPCSETKEFRREAMRPYRISEDAFSRGYAHEDEYEVLPAKLKEANEGQKPR